MEIREFGPSDESSSGQDRDEFVKSLSHTYQMNICREVLDKLRYIENEDGQLVLKNFLQGSSKLMLAEFMRIQEKVKHGRYESIFHFSADMKHMLDCAVLSSYRWGDQRYECVGKLSDAFWRIKGDLLIGVIQTPKLYAKRRAPAKIEHARHMEIMDIQSSKNNGFSINKNVKLEKSSNVKRGRKPTLKNTMEKSTMNGSAKRATKLATVANRQIPGQNSAALPYAEPEKLPSVKCGYYLTGLKGGRMLVCNGYVYSAVIHGGWRCTDMTCRLYVRSIDLPDGQVLIESSPEHNHGPNEKKIIKLRVCHEIKRLALDNMEKSAVAVILEAMNAVADSDKVELPSRNWLMKMVDECRSGQQATGEGAVSIDQSSAAVIMQYLPSDQSTSFNELSNIGIVKPEKVSSLVPESVEPPINRFHICLPRFRGDGEFL